MPRFRQILFSVVPAGQKLMGAVTLYEDTWHGHIVARHPELNGCLRMAEETIQAPTAIYEPPSSPGTYLFVRSGMTDSAGRLLRVVVGAGRVKTAYFSSATGGSRVWP